MRPAFSLDARALSARMACFWRMPLAELRGALDATEGGLRNAEAAVRSARFGANVLHANVRKSLAIQFLRRFRNPLILVLLAASTLAGLTGQTSGMLMIWTMILLSVTLDFFQEYRAGRAAEQLKQSVAVEATVLRDGREVRLPMSAVVPGDVALVSAGDLIPADGRLIDARDLFVNQSLLTGESYPVEKHANPAPTQNTELSQADNAVFMGTSVVSGMGRILVCRTGNLTEVGGISDMLSAAPPPTAFDIGIRRFGMLIMRMTVLLVLFVFLANTLQDRPVVESLLFAIALAVGLTPELLPMVITVTLARGAIRMAQKRVIVKQLAAIQNLGGMDVLCTDKTGTLTVGQVRLERHVDAAGAESAEVLEYAYLNSSFETGLKSPLDHAILECSHLRTPGWTKIDEVPFDFERRRVSVLLERAGVRELIVKGAPEDVLRASTRYARNGADVPLDPEARQRIDDLQRALETSGLKVLGIARRAVAPDHPHALVDDESALIFVGFVAFADPPKETAAAALQQLAGSGVAVKVLTGDSEHVTRHVFARLGIPIDGVLTGAEVERLDDTALAVRAQQANLFCRVTPGQKNRIILALKARGHTVGYLGDGINDAPSLHSADIGISVDSGVDVAKAAASMILLDHDLGVLREGIVEGRRTFANIMKYIMMGTSSNFGNMFTMAGASLFLAFLPMLPTQILLNNLLYDLSELPIPVDRVDQDALALPATWDIDLIRRFMWAMGPISSLFDILTFAVLLKVIGVDEAGFHTGWFIESIATQVLVIFIIRTRGNPFASRPAAALAATAAAIVLIAVLLPFLPGAGWLGFVPPPALFFVLLPAMVIAYLATVEVAKRRFFRYHAT